MEIDYIQISQLKVPEVLTYLQQKLKSSHLEKPKNKKSEKTFHILKNLGNEFYIFFLTMLAIGIYNFSIYHLLATLSCLIFIVTLYLKISKLFSFEEKLNTLHLSKVKVLRDNKIFIVPESELKIGDIILFSAGERIPCDVRVIESNSLVVDESKVFGEGRKVGKSATTLPKKEFKIYELSNIIFANSLIVKGYGKGIVINTKPTSFVSYKTFLKEKNIPHTILSIALSITLSLILFYITRDITISLTSLATTLFLTSYKHIEFSKTILKYIFSKKLLLEGIILPSINKIEELREIERTIIKLEQTSFDIYKPQFFLIKAGKSFSSTDLLLMKEKIPQELIYCYVISTTIYSKTKDFQTKIILNSIINYLSSIGIEHLARNYKLVESNISNTLEFLSTIKVKNLSEVSISLLSLKSYEEKFGTILPTKPKQGLVMLTKEETLPNSSIDPTLVITFTRYPYSISNNLKFFMISEMSSKEILKYLELVGIDTSKVLIAKYEDIEHIPEEQKRFLIEKFQILSDIPQKNVQDITKLLGKENQPTIDSFIEMKNSDIGIMKVPYFGTFFSKNNLVLSLSNTFLAPFILKKEAEQFQQKILTITKLKKLLLFLLTTITVCLLMHNNLFILPLLPITYILINSKASHYTISLPDANEDNKSKS